MKTLTLCLGLLASGAVAGTEDVPAEGVAVVELFTSEGCSSCPPADRLLAVLAGEGTENLYALAYHVTYWDYLGWRDPFGQERFDERQRRYARLLGERTYTPQMIVNGREVFVGSDEGRARSAIREALRVPARAEIAIEVSRPATNKITVSYDLRNPASKLTLHFAVVERGLESRVSRGENAGRTLGHVAVVRGFSSVDAEKNRSGTVEIEVPAALNSGRATVVVWAQEPDSLAIVGASAEALE